MAKRETFEGNEDYLKDMMAGDVPRIRQNNNIKNAEEEETAGDEEPEPQVSTVAKPKKKHAADYEQLFLKPNMPGNRKQTYISANVMDKINRYLPVLNRNLSIAGHIDNILLHHLEQYKDEINRLYELKSQKPL